MGLEQLRQIILMIMNKTHSNRWIASRNHCSPTTVGKVRQTVNDNQLTKARLDGFHDDELSDLFYEPRCRVSHKVIPDFYEWRKRLKNRRVTFKKLYIEYEGEYIKRAYSESHLRRLYLQWAKDIGLTYMNDHPPAGSIQVDFTGDRIRLQAKNAKKRQKVEFFVSAMPCSGIAFVYACLTQSTEDFSLCHNRMFRYYGGGCETLVPDNLKAAVITPGAIPKLNRTYELLGKHYSTFIFPARPLKPQDKAFVENTVKLIEIDIIEPLKHLEFETVDQVNEAILPLLEAFNNKESADYPDGRRRLFEQIEKQHLIPLPDKDFEIAFPTAKIRVGSNYHVRVKGHYYSVPYEHRNQHVTAIYNDRKVEIFKGMDCIAVHKRSFEVKKKTTVFEHMPAKDQYWASRNKEDYTSWAQNVGPNACYMVDTIFAKSGDRINSRGGAAACDQLKHLCRTYGEERFEQACAYAIRVQRPVTKTVHSVLSSNVDLLSESVPENITLPKHENVRGSDYFTEGL